MSSDSAKIETGLRRGPAAKKELSAQAASAARRLGARIAGESLADIAYAQLDSPLGPLSAAITKRGLVRVAFPEESLETTLERLSASISPRIVEGHSELDPLRRELEEYFTGSRRRFELPLDWRLMSPFGRRVLKMTTAIPYGGHLSYAEVAAEAGSPRGARAAGNALGANPIPIVIPCHRVLHAGGGIGGYGGGLERKRFLLELEGALPASAR
jgi:methylated-DNA-[protein]-cysteine S-methyltransferase